MSILGHFNKRAAKNIARVVLPMVLAMPLVIAPQKAEASFILGYMMGSSGGSRGPSAAHYELNEAMTDLSVSKARIEKAFEGRHLIRLENLDACRTEVNVPEKVTFDTRQELAEKVRSCMNVHDTADAFGAATPEEMRAITDTAYWEGHSRGLWGDRADDALTCRAEQGLPGVGETVKLNAEQTRDIYNCLGQKRQQRADHASATAVKVIGGILGGSALLVAGGVYLGSRRRKKPGNGPKR